MNRIFACIAFLAICLYGLIDQQNRLTKKQLAIPQLTQEIKMIHEESARLKYVIEQFENPEHLLTMYRQGAFSQLHFPTENCVVCSYQGLALVPVDVQTGEMPAHAAFPRTFVATLSH